ncbi:MAG: hypothetical protein JNL00_16510, partial [Candidatus Accumulibacter sp.]|nr:hypothetical protein [Accumulibacter sp.]
MNPEQFSNTPEDDGDSRTLTPLICEGLLPIELPARQRTDLRDRLLRRVGDSVRRHSGLLTVRTGDGIWRTVKAGVRTK